MASQIDTQYIRDQIRKIVDPLFIDIRESLYGPGASYNKYISTSVLPQDLVHEGDVDSIVTDLGFIKGLTIYSGETLIATNQKELSIVGAGIYTEGVRSTITIPSGIMGSGLEALDISVDGGTIYPTTLLDFQTDDTGAYTWSSLYYDGAYHVQLNMYPHINTIASDTELGHIKTGSTLFIDGDGVLNTVWVNPMTTEGDILYGDLSGDPIRLPIGDNDQVLTVVNGLPEWTDSQAGSMSNPMTTAGDIIYGDTAGAPLRLPIGSSGEVLTVISGLPRWQTPVVASGSTAYTIWVSDAPPVNPSTIDDEFDDRILNANWTEWDVGSKLIVTEEDYGAVLSYSAGGSYNAAGIYQTKPTGDLTIITKISILATDAHYFIAGLLLGQDLTNNPSTSDFVTYAIYKNSADSLGIYASLWSNYQSETSVYFSDTASIPPAMSVYLRIRIIGSTLYFDHSFTGLDWYGRASSSTPFTVSQIGFYANGNNNLTSTAIFQFFRISTDTNLSTPLLGQRIRLT